MCLGICIVLCACIRATQIPGTRKSGHGFRHVTSDNVVSPENTDSIGENKAEKQDDSENKQKNSAAPSASDEPDDVGKVAYLTFDDGPSVITEDVLDILKEEDVKATFFMIGNQINEKTKPIVDRLCSEGHQIGVHTFCHEAGSIYCSAESYYSDLMKAEQIILEYTGTAPLVYRFPWGSANGYIKGFRKEIVCKLSDVGMEYCDWNVSGEDSIGTPSAAQIYKNVRKNYDKFSQPVILLHDSATRKETVRALPDIIKLYKEAGYTFDIIKNREKPFQWMAYD
ncbi:MAG: polysaccharide deacetylase [Lachnospiraceae bacterium]|nr:polysaccharide deacetylase [Lachnospiraceae bacterium]